MFSTEDLGKKVKITQINSQVVRGIVEYVSVSRQRVGVNTGVGTVTVSFSQISTVSKED